MKYHVLNWSANLLLINEKKISFCEEKEILIILFACKLSKTYSYKTNNF